MDKGDFKADIIKQEIDLLVKKVNHFDDPRYRTKRMAATLWIAAIGAALTLPSYPLLWLALGVPLPFWYFDACYNGCQAGFERRFWAIRDFIQDGKFKLPNGRKPTLDDFLTAGSNEFPVPDYYGNETFDTKLHEWHTSKIRNAFTLKMVLFYGSLTVVASLLLLVFKWLNLGTFMQR